MSTSQRPLPWVVGIEGHLEPNKHLCDLIVMSILNEVGNARFAGIFSSFTELYSQINMVVFGQQAFIFSHSDPYANVQVFTKEGKGLPAVPPVDAVIAYDCPS